MYCEKLFLRLPKQSVFLGITGIFIFFQIAIVVAITWIAWTSWWQFTLFQKLEDHISTTFIFAGWFCVTIGVPASGRSFKGRSGDICVSKTYGLNHDCLMLFLGNQVAFIMKSWWVVGPHLYEVDELYAPCMFSIYVLYAMLDNDDCSFFFLLYF